MTRETLIKILNASGVHAFPAFNGESIQIHVTVPEDRRIEPSPALAEAMENERRIDTSRNEIELVCDLALDSDPAIALEASRALLEFVLNEPKPEEPETLIDAMNYVSPEERNILIAAR